MILKNSKHSLWLKLTLVTGLGIAGLFSLSPTPGRVTVAETARPLLIEEQEIVVKVLSDLEAKGPETERLALRLRNADPALLWDPSSTRLIKRDGESLVFSKRFFEADSIAQQLSLKDLVDPSSSLARGYSTRPTGER